MSKRLSAVLSATLSSVLALGLAGGAYGSIDPSFQSEFNLDECDLSTTGVNDYFYLIPGYRLVLTGQEDGDNIQLIMTVTNNTRVVDGVETRVVEERESENGELTEISSNYFAMCAETGDIFYFGEEVDIYEGGVVVKHEGEWLAGENNARPGLIIPANPTVGMKYYQEVALGVAEDRAEIVSLNETIFTPAGIFDNVLKVEETNPLDNETEYKFHAPGIGLIQDADLKLEEYAIPEVEPEEPVMTSQDQSVTVEGSSIEVVVNSSSTISAFTLDEASKMVSFKASGEEGTEGATVIAVGAVLEGPYAVTVDGEPTTDYEQTSGASGESVLSISYTHGIGDITITGTNVVPEFPAALLAAIAATIGLVALVGRNRFRYMTGQSP